MENKTLKLRIESATNLTKLNNLFQMNVYAIVYVPNSNNETAVTHIHYDSGTNPTWNDAVNFTVNQNHHSLKFMVMCESPTAGSIKMGTVCIALKDLFDNTSGDSFRQISYKVMTDSGEEGNLNLSYKFEDKVQDPVTNTAATQNLDPQISQPAAAGSALVLPGYPPSGYPQSGYLPSGYPPSGYPQSGHPPSGYPPSGYPPSGYPPSGYPQSGYLPSGYPPSGYPQSGHPWSGYPPSGYPQPGYPPSCYPQSGYPPSGYPPSGYPQPGYPPSCYPQPGYPPSCYPQPGYPPQTYQWPYLPANFGNGIKAGFLGYGLGGDKLTNIGNMISGDSASGSGSAISGDSASGSDSASAFPFD